MGVILRNSLSRFCYGGDACWIDDPEHALDLGTIERATETARTVGFGRLEVVVSFDEPDCELVLPLACNPAGAVKASARAPAVPCAARRAFSPRTDPVPPSPTAATRA